MTLIKFCGLTQPGDVDLAGELGAQAVGFVFWPPSPRFVGNQLAANLIRRVPLALARVGVFVEPSLDDLKRALDLGIDIVQLHGDDRHVVTEGMTVWRARCREADVSAVRPDEVVLLDADDPERHGGTGRTADWQLARRLALVRPIVLAGGLTPTNVGEAIDQVRPFGVDVSSGIEIRPGIKDHAAMRAFVAAAANRGVGTLEANR